jgi:hypothetical protein
MNVHVVNEGYPEEAEEVAQEDRPPEQEHVKRIVPVELYNRSDEQDEDNHVHVSEELPLGLRNGATISRLTRQRRVGRRRAAIVFRSLMVTIGIAAGRLLVDHVGDGNLSLLRRTQQAKRHKDRSADDQRVKRRARKRIDGSDEPVDVHPERHDHCHKTAARG